MSTNESTTTRQINIPDNTAGTHIAAEYGCRYPDGHYEWGTFTDYSGVSISFARIVAVDGEAFNADSKTRWLKTLTRKAAAASIHPSEFIEDHAFVKRQVILVTTKPEEV